MRRNYFNDAIPNFRVILARPKVRDFVEFSLDHFLRELAVEEPGQLVGEVLSHAEQVETEDQEREYEARTHEILMHVSSRFSGSLDERAEMVAGHVLPYLDDGQAVLDYGCGDGRVMHSLLRERNITPTTVDVYQHERIQDRMCAGTLNFHQIPQGEPLLFTSNRFDVSMALMMLHHSDNPAQNFQEMVRVTKPGGTILVIESVYDIPEDEREDYVVNDGRALVAEKFKKLNSEQQRLANIFFDHLYNRVLTDPDFGVNVPYNFRTPWQWNNLFRNNGTSIGTTLSLGIDMKLAPEYHTLHVLMKPEK